MLLVGRCRWVVDDEWKGMSRHWTFCFQRCLRRDRTFLFPDREIKIWWQSHPSTTPSHTQTSQLEQKGPCHSLSPSCFFPYSRSHHQHGFRTLDTSIRQHPFSSFTRTGKERQGRRQPGTHQKYRSMSFASHHSWTAKQYHLFMSFFSRYNFQGLISGIFVRLVDT